MRGIEIRWIFDPVYSSQIIFDCDTDMDFHFNEDEIADVYEFCFINYEHYGFFCSIQTGGSKLKVKEVKNFSALIDEDDEVVIYSFFIPLKIPYSSNLIKLRIRFADPTYYTCFFCPQQEVEILGYRLKIMDGKIDYGGTISFSF